MLIPLLAAYQNGWVLIAETGKYRYALLAKGDRRRGYDVKKGEIIHSYRI